MSGSWVLKMTGALVQVCGSLHGRQLLFMSRQCLPLPWHSCPTSSKLPSTLRLASTRPVGAMFLPTCADANETYSGEDEDEDDDEDPLMGDSEEQEPEADLPGERQQQRPVRESMQ